MDVVEKFSRYVTCEKCGTRLKVYKDDLEVCYSSESDEVLDSSDLYPSSVLVECSVCHGSIDVTEKVPGSMREELFDKARK